MKTSWNNIQQIEGYLLHTASDEDRAFFRARLLFEPELESSILWQQAAYTIINEYGRQKLRQEIEEVAHVLFTTEKYNDFRQKVWNIFKK